MSGAKLPYRKGWFRFFFACSRNRPLWAGLIIFTGSLRAIAADNVDTKNPASPRFAAVPVSDRLSAFGPYCGIASVYSALASIGVEVDFSSLVEPEFVGSRKGSTAIELTRAIQKYGAYGNTYVGLTADFLRAASTPVILHVSANRRPGSRVFDHWIAFLGTEDGKACIAEPMHGTVLVSFSDLLGRWDGTGIIVSKSPTQTLTLWGWAWQSNIIFVLILFDVGLLLFYPISRLFGAIYSGQSRTSIAFRPVAQLALLVLLGAGLGAGYHCVQRDGLLSNLQSAERVSAAYLPENVERLSLEEVIAHMKRGDVILVDARLEDSFKYGGLPGAINIPVDATDDLRLLRLESAKVDKNSLIVIYCQSSVCPYSDNVARTLTAGGYKNLRIFQGGYVEWKNHNVASASTDTTQ